MDKQDKFEQALEKQKKLEEQNQRGTKVCPACGKELPLSMFGKAKHTWDGLTSSYKECRNLQQRQSRAKLKEKKEAAAILDSAPDKVHRVYTNPDLAKFTARQLRDELGARGFHGKLKYTQEFEV